MTREEAIEYAEKKKIKLEEEIERHGSYYGAYAMYSTELEFVSMAISALRQQEIESNLKALESTEPITLDELRQMDGEPVWVVYGEDEGMWALVEVCEESIFLTNNLGGRSEYAADVELEDDGITVYRQKPEEGTV